MDSDVFKFILTLMLDSLFLIGFGYFLFDFLIFRLDFETFELDAPALTHSPIGTYQR